MSTSSPQEQHYFCFQHFSIFFLDVENVTSPKTNSIEKHSLQQTTHIDKPFGDLHVIIIGDMLQIEPVEGKSMHVALVETRDHNQIDLILEIRSKSDRKHIRPDRQIFCSKLQKIQIRFQIKQKSDRNHIRSYIIVIYGRDRDKEVEVRRRSMHTWSSIVSELRGRLSGIQIKKLLCFADMSFYCCTIVSHMSSKK